MLTKKLIEKYCDLRGLMIEGSVFDQGEPVIKVDCLNWMVRNEEYFNRYRMEYTKKRSLKKPQGLIESIMRAAIKKEEEENKHCHGEKINGFIRIAASHPNDSINDSSKLDESIIKYINQIINDTKKACEEKMKSSGSVAIPIHLSVREHGLVNIPFDDIDGFFDDVEVGKDGRND